jgi:hypothetical protein
MVKINPQKIDEEVRKQNEDVYGDEPPEAIDVDKVVEDTFGEEPSVDGTPSTIADRVNEDERAHGEIPPDNTEQEEDLE